MCAAPGRILGGVKAEKPRAVTRFPAIGFWILALLVALALATQPSTAQDKAPNEDSSITTRVESALSKDAILGKLDITVVTRQGVVSLTGFVRSLEDVARAGGRAKAVQGVADVRNELQVANRPSRA